MRRIALLISVFAVYANSFGQAKFFKTYADNGFDFGQGIIQLEDSSYLVTGTSSSFMNAPSEVFLMKLNKFGVHQWARHYGGEEADWGKKILNWKDSVFFLAGHTQTIGENGYDLYLVKVDRFGNLINDNIIGTVGWDRVNDALITSDSTIIMVGETTNTINNNSNFYIVKTDHNGDTLWTKNFGSTGFDVLNSVVQYDATTFYAAGAYYNADSSLYKGAIVKFNELGEVDWIKQYGAYGEYQLYDIYLRPGKICGVGTRKHPIVGDQDEWQLRINDDGSPWLMDFEQHKPGEINFVGAALYGDDSKAYVVWSFNDQFSANNSFDVGYIRYENNLDYEWFNPSIPQVYVNFTMDDEHGEIIRTSDGGWVAVGTVPSVEFGGSAVYVLKTGPNDDFPEVLLGNSSGLVEIEETKGSYGIEIYPNPSSIMLKINSHENDLSFLSVRDLNGRTVVEFVYPNNEMFIETANWNNGIYFIEFKMENGTILTKKLLVQH
jgi:hypothetical protein